MGIEEKPKNVKVETFADDMTKAIESIGTGEGGFVKKIIHGEEEEDLIKSRTSSINKKSQIFMLLSFALVLLAIASVSIVYVFKNTVSTVPVAPQYKPIIFTDQNKAIEISELDIEKIIEKTREGIQNTGVKIGGIEGIYFTNNKNIIELKDFFIKMGVSLDENNLSIFETNFLAGVNNLEESFVNTDTEVKSSKNFFILLKVKSTADAFNVFHFWENKMFGDLGGFFGVPVNADTKYLLEKDFEDGIIQNKNARILYDDNGEIVIMYVYLNDTTVVFANSEKTIGEIIARLAASQIKK